MPAAGEVVAGQRQRLAFRRGEGFGVVVALVAKRTAGGKMHGLGGHGVPVRLVHLAPGSYSGCCQQGPARWERDKSYSTDS